MRKFLIITLCILIFSLSCVSVFAIDTYEYNDYALYSTGGTYYSFGAFRSNNSNLTSFTLIVNVNDNTWSITNGTEVDIPFPVGVEIEYTDRTTFLQSAYVYVNGTRKNFTYIDDSGEFYCQNIPASPNYPQVNVYLPTQGSPVSVPPEPILAYSEGYITWNTEGVYTEVYRSDSSVLAGTLYQSGLTGSRMKIREGDDGYYYIRYRYSVNGENRYTDYSNRVYAEWVEYEGEEPSNVDKFIDFIEDIRNGLENAVSTIEQFVVSVGGFIQTLVSWLPSEVSSVFFAVVIIGLVMGIFIK